MVFDFSLALSFFFKKIFFLSFSPTKQSESTYDHFSSVNNPMTIFSIGYRENY